MVYQNLFFALKVFTFIQIYIEETNKSLKQHIDLSAKEVNPPHDYDVFKQEMEAAQHKFSPEGAKAGSSRWVSWGISNVLRVICL